MTRGQRGRLMGQAMIAIAVLVIAGTALLFVSTLGLTGPPMMEPPLGSYAIYGLGVVGIVVGLVWMIRIYRADPEPDQHVWRYRAKR